MPLSSQAFRQTFKVADLRTMAGMSGGQLAAYQYGWEAVDRIDRATRFRYVLTTPHERRRSRSRA